MISSTHACHICNESVRNNTPQHKDTPMNSTIPI